MLWSILNRYILLELLRVFVMALIAITAILVMAGIVAEAAQQGLGPDQILKLVPLLIPGTLPYTVPATLLFAVSVVFGRLSADSELTAIKAAGIPVTRILWPAFLLGGLVSGAVFFLYQDFIPRNHHRLRTTALRDIEELIYSRLRRDLSFNEPRVNYAIWVKEVQGHRLIRPTFKKRDSFGRDEIIAQAAEAELDVDLPNEVVYVRMKHGEMSKDGGETYVIFAEESVPVPLPPIGAARQIRAREMTNKQILQRKALLLQRQVELEEAMSRQAADARKKLLRPAPAGGEPRGVRSAQKPPPKPSDPSVSPGQEAATPKVPGVAQLPLHLQLGFLKKEIQELETEFAVRPALSLGCFFFVLIGCPVAIWFHKRDYLSAFVVCFLPIVVVYYPLMMFGINLGKEGRLDPAYFIWSGNAVLGAAGLILLWRLVRR